MGWTIFANVRRRGGAAGRIKRGGHIEIGNGIALAIARKLGFQWRRARILPVVVLAAAVLGSIAVVQAGSVPDSVSASNAPETATDTAVPANTVSPTNPPRPTSTSTHTPTATATPPAAPAIALRGLALATDVSGTPDTQTAGAPLPIITTVAGNGTPGFSGDGGPATSARFTLPLDVVVDSAGNTYVADSGNNRVRKITPGGTISTYAGGGTSCAGQTDTVGDGCQATQAILSGVTGLALDSAGRLYISDQLHQRVRRVETDSTITTFAGTGTAGYAGDGGPATSAMLRHPFGLTFDTAGNLYIADASNHAIRKVTPAATISTVAGDGFPSYNGDGIEAPFAELNFPTDVAVDTSGNIYIADSGNHAIRLVNGATRIMSTYIGQNNFGSGVPGFAGDGGPVASARLSSPFGVLLDGQGQLFIADSGNQRIRFVNGAGIITTVAGTGQAGYGGDGGPATAALLDVPMGLGLRANGDLLIADMNNHRIRALEPVAAGPSPTPTATPPPTATPTPCPDYDGDTICNASDPDDDDDGCTDTAEQQSSPGSEISGGRRNPQYFWDVYDVWTQSTNPPVWLRNKTIDLLGDIFGVALRYGTQGGVPGTETQRIFAALTPPTDDTGYHIDYDRSAPGADVWDTGPPDGTIDLFNDIFGVAFQFGHSCD